MVNESLIRLLMFVAGSLACLSVIPGVEPGRISDLLARRNAGAYRVALVEQKFLIQPVKVAGRCVHSEGRDDAVGALGISLLPEEAARIAVGPDGMVVCAVDGRKGIACSIRRIHQYAEREFVNLELRFKEGAYRPPGPLVGRNVDVLIPLRSLTTRLVVPQQAVVLRDGLPRVLSVGKGVMPEWRIVEVGDGDEKSIEIFSGLAEGDSVLLVGSARSMLTRSRWGDMPAPGEAMGGQDASGGSESARTAQHTTGRPSPDQRPMRPIP
jgi:hypothetical protein